MMAEEQDKDEKYTVEKDKYFPCEDPGQPASSKRGSYTV